MSKIEELLKNEKVEWKRLGEFTEVGTGSSNTNEQVEDGLYPFYVRSKSIKRNNKYEFDDESIVIPGEGGVGDVFHYVNGKYALHQRAYRIHLTEDSISTKFIYYYMVNNFKKYILRNAVQATVLSIRKPKIENFYVPIPSLEIQEKIVKTLDKFTKYVSELQTELQFRLKQYEYYRNMLLSENSLNEISAKLESQLIHGIHKIQFSKEEKNECVGIENYIIWCKIADVCLRQRGIPITAEKMKELHKDNAPVRIFAGGNTFADISMEDIDEKNIINTPSVVVKSRGNIDFEFYDRQFSHKNEMWSYSSLDNNKLNIKFMYYYLKNNVQYFRDNAISGKLPQISTGTTDNYKIPIPNIEIQNHVVTILDKFQDILSDTKGMLPKEIELRQKQYEYYREKLLTFDVDYGRERERVYNL